MIFRRAGLEYMIKEDYEMEEVEEMRQMMKHEGWEMGEDLPLNWFVRKPPAYHVSLILLLLLICPCFFASFFHVLILLLLLFRHSCYFGTLDSYSYPGQRPLQPRVCHQQRRTPEIDQSSHRKYAKD